MSRAPSERPSAFSPLGLLSDERLGSMAAAGSTAAFAVLYERHAQGLYRFCRSITREEADAQDALQSAMERALRAMRRGARDAPVRPWLFRIAHNEAVSVLRRRARAADLGEQLPTGTAPSAEQVLAERLRLEQLLSDLAELPERQRVALVLRELSGLSHREIGLVFQISEGAAKQSIFEARTALAELERGRVMDCVDVRQRISDRDGRVLRSRRVRAHLRGCAECTRFRLAMGQRPAELAALAPVLPGTAIAGVLARALTGTPIRSAASTSTSASAGGVAASALGKAGGGLAVKALVSGGVIAAAIGTAAHIVSVRRPARHPTGYRSGAPSSIAGAPGAAAVTVGPSPAALAAAHGPSAIYGHTVLADLRTASTTASRHAPRKSDRSVRPGDGRAHRWGRPEAPLSTVTGAPAVSPAGQSWPSANQTPPSQRWPATSGSSAPVAQDAASGQPLWPGDGRSHAAGHERGAAGGVDPGTPAHAQEQAQQPGSADSHGASTGAGLGDSSSSAGAEPHVAGLDLPHGAEGANGQASDENASSPDYSSSPAGIDAGDVTAPETSSALGSPHGDRGSAAPAGRP